jgi:hypothetical protein
MAPNFRNEFDPLDLEILERALDGTLATLREDEAPAEADSDAALEADLRRELVEIARCNGMPDPETLRDMLLAALSNKQE